MRSIRTILALSVAGTLAACGGDTAPQTVGSVAPPAGSPTPTHSFVAPTDPKTYDGLGAVQHYEYHTQSNVNGSPVAGSQGGQLYAGDANTVRDSGITLSYNPRDAIFELTINRPKGIVSVSASRFQDPAHRTNFGGATEPQAGVPDLTTALNGIQYLEAGGSSGTPLIPKGKYDGNGVSAAQSTYPVWDDASSSTVQTFFYQKPGTTNKYGTTTRYVSYAGFVRNTIAGALQQPVDTTAKQELRETYSFDRAAFVFGERTPNGAIPTSGSGTFTGDMIASVVYNPMLDIDAAAPSYLQWMSGKATTNVDFASGVVTTHLDGTALAPPLDAYTSGAYLLAAGTTFSADGKATIDIVNKGGFTGQFTAASFAGLGTINIAGSSLDGAFFGPNGEEVGAGFRIVGGTPDQRIDILGAYTGAKK
ncbi:hypothetical protein IAG41_07400 [Sphingomonas sp. JC676]|uniref:hypothetical protein n=1 Tax=Sphingomonas sp. JC676 TaxID=2768065 RepID=UPI00165775A8|nr:hypothetical protein [Sphingomonas sp. JC676]MBC9032212.1 hypothetical protein [Sphingomonas sp. JC676]